MPHDTHDDPIAEAILESDPITWCLFNTSSFNTYGYVFSFSSGHLFRGRNSSVESGNYVDIQDGEFTCDP